MWPLKTIFFFGLFISSAVVALWLPIVGMVNYMLVYQVLPESHWWSRPLNDMGFRYSMWAAVTMVLGMLIAYQTRRLPKVRPFMNWWEGLALLLVAFAVCGHFTAEKGGPWQDAMLDKFCKMMFFVFCMTHLVTTRRAVMIFLWALVVGSLWVGYDAFTAPIDLFAHGRLNSVGGSDFRNSSGLGLHMSAMLPVIGTVFLLTKQWRWRLVPLLSGVLTVNTAILCRTRSAYVAVLIGAVVAVLLAPKSWRWRTYLALGLVVIGVFLLTDAPYWERMATLQSAEARQEDAAVQIRYAVWEAGIKMVKDYPWGVGIGNFMTYVGRYDAEVSARASHNTLLLCTAELGIPALLAFLLIVAISLRSLRSVHRLANRTDDPAATRMLVYGLLVSFVIYFSGGQFTERLYTEALWWVLALPVCLRRAAMREVEARELETGPEFSFEEEPWDELDALPSYS